MSLFQCESCGCAENTALSAQGFKMMLDNFDWSYAPHLKGMLLCSACGPVQYSDGYHTDFGVWHGQFERVFLPKGMFFTNRVGNLEHKETGETDFKKHRLNGS